MLCLLSLGKQPPNLSHINNAGRSICSFSAIPPTYSSMMEAIQQGWTQYRTIMMLSTFWRDLYIPWSQKKLPFLLQLQPSSQFYLDFTFQLRFICPSSKPQRTTQRNSYYQSLRQCQEESNWWWSRWRWPSTSRERFQLLGLVVNLVQAQIVVQPIASFSLPGYSISNFLSL